MLGEGPACAAAPDGRTLNSHRLLQLIDSCNVHLPACLDQCLGSNPRPQCLRAPLHTEPVAALPRREWMSPGDTPAQYRAFVHAWRCLGRGAAGPAPRVVLRPGFPLSARRGPTDGECHCREHIFVAYSTRPCVAGALETGAAPRLSTPIPPARRSSREARRCVMTKSKKQNKPIPKATTPRHQPGCDQARQQPTNERSNLCNGFKYGQGYCTWPPGQCTF